MPSILMDLSEYDLDIEITRHALEKRFVQRWPGPAPNDREAQIKKLVEKAVFHAPGNKPDSLIYWSRDLNWKLYLNILPQSEDGKHKVYVISCVWIGERKNKHRYRDKRAKIKCEVTRELKNC